VFVRIWRIVRKPRAAKSFVFNDQQNLKNSLTGDEPEPILNYKTNHPSFPHESTADEFFDDAQFESYRALGYHIAEHTFARWVHTDAFRQWRQVLT
jgi:hypothetical protein